MPCAASKKPNSGWGRNMAEDKLLNLSIEPRRGRYNVYQWYIMGAGSVLTGTEQKRWLDDFETKDEAIAAFPKADVYVCWVAPQELPEQAPAGYYNGDGGFYDAGEYWSESDY